MTHERPTSATCANPSCGKPFTVGAHGPVQKYCRPACRVAAYNKRQRGPKVSAADKQRALIWELLQAANLVPADKPLPLRKSEDAA